MRTIALKHRKSNSALAAKVGKALKLVRQSLPKGVRLGTYTKVAEDVNCIPTGWEVFDDLLTGVVDDKTLETVENSGRGLPMGRLIEVYGPESTLKTTLALQLIAAAQKQGLVCAFIDVEYSFDAVYAKRLGVDVTNLIFKQPDSAEEACDLVKLLAKSGLVAFIVLDSVAALDPESEQEKKAGKTMPGVQARLMSQTCRKLTPIIGQTGTTVLFINQVRTQFGVMFGNPESSVGGKALRFYAAIRIELRKIKVLKKGVKAIGTIIRAKTQKNKVAPPMREAWFTLKFGRGITSVGWPVVKKGKFSQDEEEEDHDD